MAEEKEKGRWFKNCWQPGVNKRLDQIINFLAEEDVHRCPDFEKKFSEIKEYLTHVSQKKLPCDFLKLRNAKINYNVHVEFIGKNKEQLPKSHLYTKSDAIKKLRDLRNGKLPHSTRLVAREAAKTSQQKNALLQRPRKDLPPFKQDDDIQDGFEEAFKADWYRDPDTVDEETNLVRIEERAYINASNNPASIPYLLHNPEGIFMRSDSDESNELGMRDISRTTNEASDSESSAELLDAGFTREMLQTLKKTETFMNDCLKKLADIKGSSECYEFWDLLISYIPDEIKILCEQKDHLYEQRYHLTWRKFAEVERWVDENYAKYKELTRVIEDKENKWIDTLKENGITLTPTIRGDECVVILQPRSEPVEEIAADDSSTFDEFPSFDASESIDYKGVAEIRGTRRAAIQLALNLFATNNEQHRSEQRFRQVELPRPKPRKLGEVPLCLPMDPADRPVEQDPFKFTKAMLHLRKSMQDEYNTQIYSREVMEFLDRWLIPTTYGGPLIIPSSEELCNIISKKLESLLALLKELTDAEESSYRPFIQHITGIVNVAMQRDIVPPALWVDDVMSLNDWELQLLQGLVEQPSHTQEEDPRRLMPLCYLTSENIEEKARLSGFKRLIQILEKIGRLPAHEDGTSATTVTNNSSEKPELPLNDKSKIKIVQTYIENLAYKLGQDIWNFTRQLEMAKPAELLEYTTRLRNGKLHLLRNAPFIELAKELLKSSPELGEEIGIIPGLEETFTASQAVKLIQMQIIREARNNWDWIFAEKEEVWGFASNRSGKRRFFSLDKWPVQDQKGMDKTQAPTKEEPAGGSRKRRRLGLDGAYDSMSREEYYPGPAVYPFGETPYQRAVQSFIISDELNSALKAQASQPAIKDKEDGNDADSTAVEVSTDGDLFGEDEMDSIS
ncbi:hypothetical protein B7463_g3559, partial [Scytalidium lignicola]